MAHGMVIELAQPDAIKIRAGRIRDDLGDLQELIESISKQGLLHPIILDDEGYIVAGFRRYLALRFLKWETIPFIRRSNLSEVDRLVIEIEENTRRKNFDWKEEAKGKERLHALMVAAQGAPTPRSKSSTGWTIEDTAKMLGESKGKVVEDLRLAKYTDHATVGQRTSRIEAIRTVKRMEEIETMTIVSAALQSQAKQLLADDLKSGVLIAPPILTPGVFTLGRVVHDSAKNFLLTFDKESIDLILTDPPFGIDIDKSRWESVSSYTVYKDVEQADLYATLRLVWGLCHHALRTGRYLFTFCPPEFTGDWRKLLIECGFNVMPRPLIWYKMRGSLTDSFTQFAPAYETFLCAWKGDTRRPFSKPNADVFPYARPIERWHKLERAPGVLNDIIETTTAPGELVVDPFCGGGSTLAAAARLLRLFGGSDIDPLAWAKCVQRLTTLESGEDDLASDSQQGESEATVDEKAADTQTA